MNGRCFIVGAGTWTEQTLPVAPGDLLIAADGGWLPLQAIGLTPDIVLGDFDSAPAPAAVPVRRFPVRKDQTDMQLAIEYGRQQGFCRFALYGGTGGRIDHTLANVQCLLGLARQGAQAILYGNGFALCVLADGALRFPPEATGTLSVFALGGPAQGVEEQGLSYPAQGVVLSPDCPTGVSNAFTGTPARVAVQSGALLLYWQRPNPDPVWE